MADALISAILQQILTINLQEADQGVRFVVGVGEEINRLRSSLQTIQAVLVDAEKRQVKEEVVKVWLNKLQQVSYDVGDVLDEWSTAILKSRIEGDQSLWNTTLLGKVCSCISSPCFCFSRVAFHLGIASKIKNLNGRLQKIVSEKDAFTFTVGLNRSIDLEPERPITSSFVDVSEIRGRDQDKKAIIRMLLSENNNQERGIPIISIVGMGGIGKTTLAQVAYNHPEVKAYFHKTIWVCVSDPFNEMEIGKTILETLGVPSQHTGLNNLLDKIYRTVEGKRFLLILDDVWTEDERKWQPLKCSLSSGSKESKILMTTRKENVGKMMGSTLFPLGKLSEEECWSLFRQIAFFDRDSSERESLEDIGKKIANKCQGLPLAVKTLGGLLRFKRLREQWQIILDSHLWELEEAEGNLFSPLLLSYYDLPSPIRQCFSYCAIFPKDHLIEKDLLIKLWMAQDLLKETQHKDMEITGEEYFDNLAIRSFFQDFERDENDDTIIIRCKMHDVVHDFAQYLRRTECYMVERSHIKELRLDSYDKCARHLTLIGGIGVATPDLISKVKKLRSLLTDSGFQISSASFPKLLDQLTCLRMLNLSNQRHTSIKEVPKEIGKLMHLRYLNFEGNTDLQKLPDTMSDLCNLQTVNIRWCRNLKKLPSRFEELINLRHLQNVNSCRFMPKGMQRLTCLRTLEVIAVSGDDIGGSKSFSLGDMENLIHLRGSLKISGLGNMTEPSDARKAKLWNKSGIRRLILNFDSNGQRGERVQDETLVLEALQPPINLEELSIIHFRGPTAPNWMMPLTMLKRVQLQNCLDWESLPPMGKLLSLEYLTIEGMKKVKKVGEEFLGVEREQGQASSALSSFSSSSMHNSIAFLKLKKLHFVDMEEWELWEDGNQFTSRGENWITSMPCLRSLYFYGCPKLKKLPPYLLRSTTLEELYISGCLILKECFEKGRGEDWHYICQIPNIKIEGELLQGKDFSFPLMSTVL